MVDKAERDVASNPPDGPSRPDDHEQSIGRRVLTGTAANYIGQLVTLATGFFLTPFVLHRLGPVQYGLWVLIGSIVAYGTILDFGIWGTVVKYVAEYRARGEVEQAHILVATALRFYVVLGAIAAILFALIAPIVPNLFRIPEADRSTATWLVVLSGLGIGVSIPSVMPSAVLRGLHRFDLTNLITVVSTLLYAATTVAVLLLGGGLLGMAAITVPATLLMQIPSIWMVNRVAPDLRFGWRGARMSAVRSIVSFSSYLFVLSLAGRLQTKTDEIVIGASLPISAVTPYSLARRLSEVVSMLGTQATRVLMPLASLLEAKDEWDRLRALYVSSSRITLALSMLLGGTLVILAGPFLTVWVGPAYADSAALVAILTAAGVLSASALPGSSLLQGIARHQPLAKMAAGTALANLALSLVLVHPLGVTGVALGTLLPEAVVDLAFVLPYTLRIIQVNAKTVLTEIWLPVVPATVVLAMILYGFGQAVGYESILDILLGASLGAAGYLAAYLATGARGEERRFYRGLALTLFTRIKRA